MCNIELSKLEDHPYLPVDKYKENSSQMPGRTDSWQNHTRGYHSFIRLTLDRMKRARVMIVVDSSVGPVLEHKYWAFPLSRDSNDPYLRESNVPDEFHFSDSNGRTSYHPTLDDHDSFTLANNQNNGDNESDDKTTRQLQKTLTTLRGS